MSDVDVVDEATTAGGHARRALVHIVQAIVDEPEAVKVEIEEDGDRILFRVHVAPDDKGKVIGRRGRVAMAMRTVTRAVGARDGMNVAVDIADD